MINKKLFVSFLRVYAFQPATALWRAVEVDVLRSFLPTIGNCLDLGCGDGKLTAILFENNDNTNLEIVGIDGDEYETIQAAQLPLYKRVHTSLASNIPEDAESFDFIISNSVLEHIQNIEETIAEISRLLKSKGKFVFTVPGSNFHSCLHGTLFNSTSRERYLREIDERLAHYRYLSLAEWEVLLSKYKLSIRHHVDYLSCAETQRWETISRFTGGILYQLGRRKHPPMSVQKNLGLRKIQNSLTLPHWLASILSSLLLIGMNGLETSDRNSCILIVAEKE